MYKHTEILDLLLKFKNEGLITGDQKMKVKRIYLYFKA